MLIKGIKLENFRQFKDASLKLATGEDGKNVTIIYGENGTGKTTFEQAFLWCLYGETSFSEKSLLNKDVERELMPGASASVVVTLDVEYNQTAYEIRREQTYTLTPSGTLKNDWSKVKLTETNEDGISEIIPTTENDFRINQILPKELSTYFFFDGERIDKMSKAIVNQNKSNEFQQAVKGLLGLQAFENAIAHLGNRNGVIKQYESKLKKSNSGELPLLYKKKDEIEARIKGQETIISNCQEEIEAAEEEITKKELSLKDFQESKELQSKKEAYEREIQNLEKQIRQNQKEILNDFHRSTESMFSMKLIEDSLSSVEGINIQDVNLNIDETIIKQLLQRGRCICGHEIREGSEEYRTLNELLDYLPPKEIGALVKDFKTEAKNRVHHYSDITESLGQKAKRIEDHRQRIIHLNNEIHHINEKLKGEDVRKEVRQATEDIEFYKKQVKIKRVAENDANQKIGGLKNELKTLESKINNFTNLDEINKKTIAYKEIAEDLYASFDKEYKTQEEKVRNELQRSINEIFNQIYEGDLALTIQENYQVKVRAYNYVGNVETSTAQSIAVIFAFIAGIIKMARDKQKEDEVATTEPYPLIMDAPLSALDEKRIKAVSTTLPSIAEQILIFIKDVDGKIAEEYMNERIGARYSFEKITEFDTQLRSGGLNV